MYYGECDLYSELFRAIAQQLGIDTQIVHSSNHSWNVIRLIDGSIFHIDETRADEGFNKAFVLTKFLEEDFKYGAVIRDGRLTSIEISQDRLYKLMNPTGDKRLDELSTGSNIPIGSFLKVFINESNWDVFNHVFKSSE